jgi:hypothetical protein
MIDVKVRYKTINLFNMITNKNTSSGYLYYIEIN